MNEAYRGSSCGLPRPGLEPVNPADSGDAGVRPRVRTVKPIRIRLTSAIAAQV